MSLKIKGDRNYEKRPLCCGSCQAYSGISEWRGHCTVKGKIVYGILPLCQHSPNKSKEND